MKNKDLAVVLSKGALGAIPIVGPLMAEIVGYVVPNQRVERLERFLLALGSKIEGIDHNLLADRFKREEVIDLLEDGMLLASRAITDDRKDYIASVVAQGVKKEQLELIQEKTLLNILSELNDVQVIMLNLFGIDDEGQEDFFNQHIHVLSPPATSFSLNYEPYSDDEDALEIYEAHKNHLLRLGLLKKEGEAPREGEPQKFDPENGRFVWQGLSMTHLGFMLLEAIGLYDPGPKLKRGAPITRSRRQAEK
ncbi:MAG: hypothetical protein H6953_15070 [Chromatiaceae bacterium]|nr:hypothetical protein [Chromatiaceae bacterium]MCP5421735.1 hypothetical protein [Chromatiaceae bacterium]